MGGLVSDVYRCALRALTWEFIALIGERFVGNYLLKRGREDKFQVSVRIEGKVLRHFGDFREASIEKVANCIALPVLAFDYLILG